MIIQRAAGLDETEAAYILVRNNEGTALAKGDVVAFQLDADSDNPGKDVELAAAASLRVAGVVRGKGISNDESIPDGEYGIVQVAGFCDFIKTDGGVSADESLKAGAGVADSGAAADQPGTVFGVALVADNASSELTSAILKNIV